MTTDQEELISECKEKLGEHFDTFVIAVMWKKEDGTNCLESTYGGGYFASIGLLHQALSGYTTQKEFPDETED